MAAVIGFKAKGVAFPVGYEGVVAVLGKKRQLASRAGGHPANDEPEALLLAEGGIGDLGHRRPGQGVGDGTPGFLGERRDPRLEALVKRHGDGEAHLLLAAGLNRLLRVETGIGPHGQLARVPRVAHPGHGLGDEASGPLGGVSRTAPQAGVQDLPGFGQDGKQGMIAPYVGVGEAASRRLSLGRRSRRW